MNLAPIVDNESAIGRRMLHALCYRLVNLMLARVTNSEWALPTHFFSAVFLRTLNRKARQDDKSNGENDIRNTTKAADEAVKPDKNRFMNNPPLSNQAYVPTEIEHIANVITHGLCIVPSVLGLTFIAQLACNRNQYVNGMIFGLALVALFSVSTSFHSAFYLGRSSVLKEILHRCDRATIYIFIAASYTPWLNMKELAESSWTSNFGWLVWLMAFFGILYQQIFHEKYKWLEITLYLIIGLIPAIALAQIEELLHMKELLLGGISYIIGVIFFKSDGRIPCAHAIWHLFVGLGALYHYSAVCKYLLGKKNELRYPHF